MLGTLLSLVDHAYPLTEVHPGEYVMLKAKGMTFQTLSYKAQGLGWVSIMRATGFLGLMKMETFIINPTEIDMPLLSYDRVHVSKKDTLIFELYDTFIQRIPLTAIALVKEKNTGLPDHDLGEHWYDSIKLPESLSKKGTKIFTKPFNMLTENYMKAYLDDCKSASPCDTDAKKEKASVYVEGLLRNGGPFTDVFKKALGEEKTAELFRRVLFGIAV